jgi:hypothetical protein
MSVNSIIYPNGGNEILNSKGIHIGDLNIIDDLGVSETVTTTQLYTSTHGGSGNLSGTLTTGTFPIASDTHTLSDSNITSDGTDTTFGGSILSSNNTQNIGTGIGNYFNNIVCAGLKADAISSLSGGFLVCNDRLNVHNELVVNSIGSPTTEYFRVVNDYDFPHKGNLVLNNFTIENDNVTASVTQTELSYLSGATSNIQDQINGISPPVLNVPGSLVVVSSTNTAQSDTDYIGDLTVSKNLFTENLYPSSDSTVDLGDNTGHTYEGVYATNVYTASLNNLGTGHIDLNTTLDFASNDTFDIGSSTYRGENVYSNLVTVYDSAAVSGGFNTVLVGKVTDGNIGDSFEINVDPFSNNATFLFSGFGNMKISGGAAYKSSGTTWSNPSDIRLKENIVNFDQGIEVLERIQPKKFNYISDKSKKQCVGVIAQDMLDIYPDCIDKSSDYLMYDANDIIYLLINSVKQLKQEINILKKNI